MPDFRYVIIGAGPAGYSAARAIREVDAEGTIALLGDEPHRPYARPPLSKQLWLGKGEETIWYEALGAGTSLLHARAVRIDREHRLVEDERGERYGYERLLIATGGKPRPLGPAHERIIAYRTLDDFRRLQALVASGTRVAVVGGGFIGSEIAAALTQHGKQVTMIFPEAYLCARTFPPELGESVAGLFRSRGVQLLPGEAVERIEPTDVAVSVRTRSGRRVDADVVVVGIGIVPSVELAREAGLTVTDGVHVNASLQTSDPRIHAAGDVARFESPVLGKSMRVEHEDAALSMGSAAGRAMAGEKVDYRHLPFFYSDLFELGYEAVGEVDARHETVADWRVPFKEGTVYFLEAGRVRGVLLWNVWGQVDAARALIAEPGPFTAEVLRGRIG